MVLNTEQTSSVDDLTELKNIGEELSRQLCAADIRTPEQLCDIGSREAWLRLKMQDPSACLNRLYALEGAIQGIRWHALNDASKHELKSFYLKYK